MENKDIEKKFVDLEERLKKLENSRVNNVANGINNLASTAVLADVIETVNKILNNLRAQ